MESFELNCTHRAQSNMGSNQYDLKFRRSITVREFIEEILEDGREWGVVRVDIGEDHYWDNPTCEYSRGKLISKLPEEYLDRIIVSGKSDGCWGNMDYLLKMEELPEEIKETTEMEGEKKVYKIELEGCDDSTRFEMELSDQEYELLSRVSNKANKTSTYGCMPRMYVREVTK